MAPSSPNVAFLDAHDSQLTRLASLAEHYLAQGDPNTSVVVLR